MVIDTIGRRGGAERQFCGLAILLNKTGYDVEVACYYPDDGYQSELEHAGVKVNRMSTSRYRISKLDKLKTCVCLINPDAIIAFKDGACMMCCMLKFLGAKWELIVCERSTTQVKNRYTSLKFNLYRFADAIVPNSNSQAQYIKNNYSFLYHKVKVITNYTDTELFHPQQWHEGAMQPESIIVVGRVSPEKNILRFLEALSLVKKESDIPFQVAWYGYKTDTEYYDTCVKKMKDLDLEDTLYFYDAISTINEEYPKHKAFCLPTLYEGFPNALCEAMSCGLPVIVSDVCDNAKIMSDGENGFLFNPYNIADMANAIKRILLLPKKVYDTFSSTSRKIALQKFSTQTFTQSYSELLQQLTIRGHE